MSAPLARDVGTRGAVLVGLTAMIGAGLFAVWAPAAAAAGSALLLALGIAAVVAFCNATASAQLATSHPAAGGTYLFAGRVLGPWWGFTAGWAFVVGKTASCAAMATTFAVYALPDASSGWQRLAGVVAVVLLTLACSVGVARTVRVAVALLLVVLGCLSLALVPAALDPAVPAEALPADLRPADLLQAAGLLFFAFAGYARIATLAEEVRRPDQLTRAVLVCVACALALYAVVGWFVVRSLGAELPGTPDPVAAAVAASGAGWATPLVRVAAVAACLGALLALLAGLSRTVLAMGRGRDLPGAVAMVDARHQVPVRAQAVVGTLVVLVVATLDVREAIGFSSFYVLLYYAVTNLAALRQPATQRRWPRGLHAAGLAGCLVLAVTLPVLSVVVGTTLMAVGLLLRLLLRRDGRPVSPAA